MKLPHSRSLVRLRKTLRVIRRLVLLNSSVELSMYVFWFESCITHSTVTFGYTWDSNLPLLGKKSCILPTQPPWSPPVADFSRSLYYYASGLPAEMTARGHLQRHYLRCWEWERAADCLFYTSVLPFLLAVCVCISCLVPDIPWQWLD